LGSTQFFVPNELEQQLLLLGDVGVALIKVPPELIGPVDAPAFQCSFAIVADCLHIFWA
jgi:hypothetical protein